MKCRRWSVSKPLLLGLRIILLRGRHLAKSKAVQAVPLEDLPLRLLQRRARPLPLPLLPGLSHDLLFVPGRRGVVVAVGYAIELEPDAVLDDADVPDVQEVIGLVDEQGAAAGLRDEDLERVGQLSEAAERFGAEDAALSAVGLGDVDDPFDGFVPSDGRLSLGQGLLGI